MFVTVMCLVLPTCIFISCSFVLCECVCVLMVLAMCMFVRVMSSLISVMSPSSLFVLAVCAYGGVVGYFGCLAFCVSFVSCICDDVSLGAVYEVY